MISEFLYTSDMEVAIEQLPDDAALLKQIVSQLLDSLRSKDRQIGQLEHRLQQLLRARFGQKAEKLDSAQLLLFAQRILVEVPPAVQEPPGASPKANGHGRKKLPRNLPRKTVVIDVVSDTFAIAKKPWLPK